MNTLQKGLLTAAFAALAVGAVVGIAHSNSPQAKYQRLSHEATNQFRKQGYTPASMMPTRYTPASYGHDAVLCFTLKKIPDDHRTYQGCADFGHRASVFTVRPSR